jgi:diguanylate cyclase (GGDEF)-like protein
MDIHIKEDQLGSLPQICVWLGGIYAIYIALGFLGISFVSLPPGHLSAVWMPSGIAFIAILLIGKKALLPVFLGSLTIKLPYLYHADSAIFSLLILTLAASIETFQGWFAHTQWHKLFSGRGIATGSDLLQFFLRVAVLPSALTVWALVMLFMMTGYISKDSGFLSVWLENSLVITMAHALGIFLTVALYQSYWLIKQSPWSKKEFQISVSSILVMLLVCAISFSITEITLYLLLPVFLVLIIHTGYAGSSIAITLISFWTIISTASGTGPFVADSGHFSMMHIMMFVLCLGLTMQFCALTLENLNANKQVMAATIERRTKELEQKNRQLLELASTDHLTGLCNRRSFEKLANKELERAQRYQTPLSLLALDLDYFKRINDSYGHAFGDKVLQSFTNNALSCLRKTDLMARLGGEEFVVLLPETTEYLAANVGEKLRSAIAAIELTTESGEAVKFTTSIGVTTATMQDENIAMMLHRADEALYDAKKLGRNKVSIYKRMGNDSGVVLP